MEKATLSVGQKTILTAISALLLVFCYIVASVLLARVTPLPSIPGGPYGKLAPLATLSFLYFAYTRGWKCAIFLPLFLLVFCWAAEECSIHTGFPFGHYYYSDKLGYKLDVVPVTLGWQYFWIFVFPAYFVSNLITRGEFFGPDKGLGKLLFGSLVGSILISGIDMVVDPLDATKLSDWVWTKNNYTGYYGIPYINYLGYVIVMTPALFIYGLFERQVKAAPIGPVNIFVASVPLVFYLLELALYGVPAPSGVFLVGCYTIGLPFLLAIDKIIKVYRGGTNGGGHS